MPNGEADALGVSVSGVSLREKWTDVSTSVRRSRVGEAGADWWAEERAKDMLMADGQADCESANSRRRRREPGAAHL